MASPARARCPKYPGVMYEVSSRALAGERSKAGPRRCPASAQTMTVILTFKENNVILESIRIDMRRPSRLARLRELPAGQRVVTRSGFAGTVVGVARLGGISLVLVDLDLLTGQPRNPVVVFPENLTPASPLVVAMVSAAKANA